jgi:transposase
MVEAAWVAVQNSARWRGVYETLKKRRGAKRAIIAVARRLLAVLVSMLKSGTTYRPSVLELKERSVRAQRRKKQRQAAQAAQTAAV